MADESETKFKLYNAILIKRLENDAKYRSTTNITYCREVSKTRSYQKGKEYKTLTCNYLYNKLTADMQFFCG